MQMVERVSGQTLHFLFIPDFILMFSILYYFHLRPSIKYVSLFEGGRVSEMLILADVGGGGLFKMLTSAFRYISKSWKFALKIALSTQLQYFQFLGKCVSCD